MMGSLDIERVLAVLATLAALFVLGKRWKVQRKKPQSKPTNAAATPIKLELSRHLMLAMYRRGMPGAEKYADADEDVAPEMRKWHAHAICNDAEINTSDLCGCFHCLEMYKPSEIADWMAEPNGRSAMCAKCQVDSVIGDASGAAMTEGFLLGMRKCWFWA